jgi:tRNA (guanine37-N1)-methyltransferase
MHFDLITIFPEFFAGPLDHGIVRRAREAGIVQIHVQDLREFTKDRHKTVDDRPFGGGEGMVLKPEPLFEAVEKLLGQPVGDSTQATAIPSGTAVVLLSAAGKLFTQETARRLAKLERIVLICGRYEGVDERVAEHLATEEISVNRFVSSKRKDQCRPLTIPIHGRHGSFSTARITRVLPNIAAGKCRKS